MKKIALLAAAVVLSASFNTMTAGKKKDKKAQQADTTAACCMVEKPLVLTTSDDSLSYAAGKSATRGLLPYLQQQLKVDTAYMADFVKGYEEALKKQEDPKYTAYMAGTQIAQMSAQRMFPGMKGEFEGSTINFNEELFHKGFISSVNNDNHIYTDSAAQAYFEEKHKRVKEALSAAYKAENIAWLEQNKKKEGVITLPDGLQYKVLAMGDGEKPQKNQTVKVKYEGKFIDGTVFDSSYKRNPQTSEFRCDKVITGWTEALQMMPVGSKWELYIPQELAYGERQNGQIKPFSTLIFTVELIDIVKEGTAAEQPTAKAQTKKPVRSIAKKK